MIEGVSTGFKKELEINGVGYKFQVAGNTLTISAGYSHPVKMEAPKGITLESPSQTELNISGFDKQAVGEFAAKKAEITLNQLKMNRASIKLYDVAKTTGEIKDVFVFTYDGKDYRWLSTSEKIKAGLEVSELLARLTGLEYPTYIDNAECITTKLSPVRGQVILAYARGTELAVHNPQLQNVQMKEAA